MTETLGSTETVTAHSYPRERGSLPAGTLLGDRYEIRESIGRGGHATVYRAFDRLLKSEVALKVVHPERDPERALSRVRREVAVARESQSPHLVRIFELGRTDDDLYLSMELLPGGSLRDRLRHGPLPLDSALRVAEAVLGGLAALHAKGVLHRDVTPQNILFTDSGEAKLGDFGLVRRLEGERSEVTREGGILGTLGYLSPEQLRGKEVGPRSDLYAAGVVLFEMLAGKRPHEATSELGYRLAAFMKVPDVRRLRPEVPRWAAGLVARLLEPRPADRFPNAEAALASLRRRAIPPRYRLRRRLLWTAVLTLLLLPPGGVLVVPPPGPIFSHLVPAGETGIMAIGTEGEEMWSIAEVEPELADRAVLVRIAPRSPRLLAMVLTYPGKWLPEDVSTLSFLDPSTGKLVREVKLPSGASYFPNDPPRFSVSRVKALDLTGDGLDEIVVSYTHVPEAPSYTVLYAPRLERARVIFYARGHQTFNGATDIDGDGGPELLFAGINNGWGWVNVVAAVRLDPWPWGEADWYPVPAAAPDVMDHPSQERYLAWYATLPRGHLEGPYCLMIEEASRKLTVKYQTGRTWSLGFEGFPWGASGGDASVRNAARQEAHSRLGEAERLRRAGALDLAMEEAQAALDSARRARETWLGQYAKRLQARLLVAQGDLDEAERRFASLAERVEDAPELASDAAVAFHLAGDLRRAVAWYERGMGYRSVMGAGKSKHEFLKGQVLALVEERRYTEALAAVDRFGATYPPWQARMWVYRAFVRWRAGQRPEVDPAGVELNWTDLERYWELEFALADGGDPKEILRRVDRFLAERPETHAEALSLRAELLLRLGRTREALETSGSARELVGMEEARSIVARGHSDLIAGRTRRLREEFSGTMNAEPADGR